MTEEQVEKITTSILNKYEKDGARFFNEYNHRLDELKDKVIAQALPRGACRRAETRPRVA